jgi:hypothetical protein
MGVTGWLQDLRGAWRSYRIGLRASGLYGRSIKLRKQARLREALDVAREGLALLSNPIVRRQEGPEGSGVVCLTIQVEWLSHELGERGAATRDLADSIAFMKAIRANLTGKTAEMHETWLPCLEARLAQERARGAAEQGVEADEA